MFDETYARNFSRLAKWCQTLTHDRATAEDLAQESLFRAMSDWDRLERLSDAARWAWLRRTAKNLFIDRFRREKRRPAEPPEPWAEDDHSRLYLSETLACLSGEECALVTLRYLQGYNSREIGGMLCISPSAVRSRLTAARAKLKKNERLKNNSEEKSL